MARQSIDVDTLEHVNPIPCASRIGPMIESSIIPPYTPGTREMPESLEDQVEVLFTHMGDLLEAAGAGWDDMLKVTFFVADPNESRPAVNGPWEQRFPDPNSRPARHNMRMAGEPGRMKISCVFTAYVQ